MKKVASKAEPKAEAKTVKVVEKPVEIIEEPQVNGMYLFNGIMVAKVLSLEPMVVETYELRNGVTVTNELTLDGEYDIQPISRQEFLERVG